MEEIMDRQRPDAQKKYRRSQENKGLVRFELQVSAESKARFDELVKAAADEIPKPWDPRRRLAKARAQIFDEITQDIRHEFFALKDQIAVLKAEIKALSPHFFKKLSDTTPLPMAIQSLADNAPALKQRMALLLQENQQLTKERLKWKENALRNEKLCDALSDYNDTLKAKLMGLGIPVD